jgi:hypothetical protein
MPEDVQTCAARVASSAFVVERLVADLGGRAVRG